MGGASAGSSGAEVDESGREESGPRKAPVEMGQREDPGMHRSKVKSAGDATADQAFSGKLAKLFENLMKYVPEPEQEPAPRRWRAPQDDEEIARRLESARNARERRESEASKPARPRPPVQLPPRTRPLPEVPRPKPATRPPLERLRRNAGEGPRSALPQLDDARISSMIKAQLDSLWARTLRQYGSDDRMMDTLLGFQHACEDLARRFPKSDFIRQYATRASRFREELDLAQVRYRDLEHFGVSLVAGADGRSRDILRKLRYFDRVFAELAAATELTYAEARARDGIRDLLARIESEKRNATEKELGKAFMSQLLGPLSRRALRKAYPPGQAGDDLNWSKLAKDLRSGGHKDLLMFGRLRPYLSVFGRTTRKPKYRIDYRGHKVPINESEPLLDVVQEFDRPEQFYRDGAPPDLDLLRMLSGDLMENTFPDEVRTRHPKKPVQKKVTVVLYDVSSSMGSQGKHLVRNSLITGFVDFSQIEVVTGQADHVVYTMAFDSRPHKPERLGNLGRAQEYFDRVRNHPITSDGGTNITWAIVEVLRMIARHRQESGELHLANILLLTDAEDHIDTGTIVQERKKIGSDVDIVLTSVTIGERNAALEELVRSQAGADVGRVYHHHISYEQAQSLIDSEARLKNIEKIAQDFDESADGRFSSGDLIRLKQLFSGLAARREVEARLSTAQLTQVRQALESAAPATPDPEIERVFGIFLATVESPVGGDWPLGERLEAFREFLVTAGREYRCPEQEILDRTSEGIRSKLLSWLKLR